MAQAYKNKFDGTKVYAQKVGHFMQLVSVLRGVTHGQAGDYLVRDQRNGDMYFMRAKLFEYEFQKTKG